MVVLLGLREGRNDSRSNGKKPIGEEEGGGCYCNVSAAPYGPRDWNPAMIRSCLLETVLNILPNWVKAGCSIVLC